MTTIKTYTELSTMDDFESRFNYLSIGGKVGEETFGIERYLNQKFYKSADWRRIRDKIILRDAHGDYCCDLGCVGYEIHGRIVIHHLNPVLLTDITYYNPDIINPEYLIACSLRTHNGIHYGIQNGLSVEPVIERRPNDTCPWKL